MYTESEDGMSVANNHVLEVAVVGDINGVDDIVNVFQFVTGFVGARDDTDVLDDLAVLIRALYDAIKAMSTAFVVWRRIRVKDLTSGLLVGEQDFATPVTGTSTGNQGSYVVAGLVSLKTNVPRVVMRKYLPISSSNQTTDSKPSSAMVTLMNAFGTALLTPLVNLSGYSYTFGYLSPKTASFVIPSGRTVSATLVTQRRRRPGVGS